MDVYKYVILGGGVAAGYAAREFAERGLEKGELALVSAEDTLPYERPPLTKDYLSGSVSGEEILIEPPSFYDEIGIDLFLGSFVERIDLNQSRLRAAGGREIGFQQLLICTGSTPRRFSNTDDLEGVFYIRTIEDSKMVREEAQKGKRVTVVGGGFIGLEAAATLREQGLEVTLLVRGSRLLPQAFAPEVSAHFTEEFRRRGVEVVFDSLVKEFRGSKRVEAVQLEDGEEMETDFVVAGIGVEPNRIESDPPLFTEQGIPVDQFLESECSLVYAAGDVAYFESSLESGRRKRIEHWDNAVRQGRHVARAMTGIREPYQELPYFFSDFFEYSFEFWGDLDGSETPVIRGNVEDTKFSVWWLKNSHLGAVMMMDAPEEERDLAPLWVAQNRSLSAEALKDSSVNPTDFEETLPNTYDRVLDKDRV